MNLSTNQKQGWQSLHKHHQGRIQEFIMGGGGQVGSGVTIKVMGGSRISGKCWGGGGAGATGSGIWILIL